MEERNMAQQILVPLDGSAGAEAALPHAMALARATSSTLVVLRSIAPAVSRRTVTWPTPSRPIAQRRWAEDRALARAYVAGVASKLRLAGLRARTAIGIGAPGAAITAYARRVPTVGLIVMATYRRSGVSRWISGSVTDKVLRRAPTPLQLVPIVEDTPSCRTVSYDTILVPLDGSKAAERALDQARAIAAATGAIVVLMSVVPTCPDVALAEANFVPFWRLTECQAQADRAARYMADRARWLEDQGLRARTKLASGGPAEEILRTSVEQNVDLIVMATHGRSRLRRWIAGSVTTEVVRGADVPVLLVRAIEHHKDQHAERCPRRLESSAGGSTSNRYGV
jgi:nucleotide-binding universal stress UspA family protein